VNSTAVNTTAVNTTAPLVDRLLVIGTGFMGASLAAAVRSRGLARQVIGLDASATAARAQSLGHLDSAIDSLKDLNQESGTLAVVVAAPVHAFDDIFAGLEQLHARCPLLWVTDIGSTKSGVIAACDRQLKELAPRFVSSHPMAGSEKNGPSEANVALFEGARVLISPMPQSLDSVCVAIEQFWLAMGALPSAMPIQDHDALLAVISHLPHAVAYSLAGAIAQSPLSGAAQSLHGGGLRDTTRIAASSPELWADIFLDNREHLLRAWSDWSLQVQALQQALHGSDRQRLIDLLGQASRWRKGFQ